MPSGTTYAERKKEAMASRADFYLSKILMSEKVKKWWDFSMNIQLEKFQEEENVILVDGCRTGERVKESPWIQAQRELDYKMYQI